MDDPLVRVKTGKMGNRGQCGQWNLLAIILCVAFAYDSKRLNQHDQAASDEKRDHEDRTGDREDIASKPGRDIGNLAPQAKVFKRDRGGRDARLGGLPAEFSITRRRMSTTQPIVAGRRIDMSMSRNQSPEVSRIWAAPFPQAR